MRASRLQLAGIIAQRTLERKFSKRDVMSLAAYLLEEKRTGEVDSLLRDVQAVWAERGFVEVVAASAHDLTLQIVRDIETEVRTVYPEAKRIVVAPKLEPEVVGGVRLEFADHQLDLSIAAKLQQFKTRAVHGKD